MVNLSKEFFSYIRKVGNNNLAQYNNIYKLHMFLKLLPDRSVTAVLLTIVLAKAV